MLKHIGSQISDLLFLVKTNAPLWFIFRHFAVHIGHRLSSRRREFIVKRDAFRKTKDSLKLSNDWFTIHIPTWLRAFEECEIETDQTLECLEIGSWQGLSAFFILDYFQNARLTCVDTWEGADEHKVDSQTLSTVEQFFDANLKIHNSRAKKYRGTSLSFVSENFEPNKFDFIYVDGSHHADDVIVDVTKCFEMLKVGGLLIMDDYLWNYYKEPMDNPAGAINCFLRMKRKHLKVICSDYQLAIRKVSMPERLVD